jgi:hypothetical protein
MRSFRYVIASTNRGLEFDDTYNVKLASSQSIHYEVSYHKYSKHPDERSVLARMHAQTLIQWALCGSQAGAQMPISASQLPCMNRYFLFNSPVPQSLDKDFHERRRKSLPSLCRDHQGSRYQMPLLQYRPVGPYGHERD